MKQASQAAVVSADCLSRRALIAGAGAAAFCAATAQTLNSAQADDAKKNPWIDAHSHIWTRDVENFPLANDSTVDDLAPPSFTAEELLEVAHKSGIGRVVLIQHHIYHGWDNSYLVDAARRFPDTFRVVGMVDNFARDATEKMEALRKQRVTGLRITPRIYGEKWFGGEMEAMWQAAARLGQNICCLIDAKDLGAIDTWCRRHPETPVVIDHFARIGVDGEIRDQDVASLCALAKHKLVTVKLSAYYALGKKRPPYLDLAPMIRRVIDAYGVERCMWASDSPYQIDGENTYAASVELLRDRLDGLSDGDRQWLFAKTAERVFFV